MDSFLKMDIFFVVTTIVVLFVGAMAGYVLYRIARILKHVEHVSEQVSHEADALRADIAELRLDIRQGKGKLKSLFGFFEKASRRRPRKEAAPHPVDNP